MASTLAQGILNRSDFSRWVVAAEKCHPGIGLEFQCALEGYFEAASVEPRSDGRLDPLARFLVSCCFCSLAMRINDC